MKSDKKDKNSSFSKPLTVVNEQMTNDMKDIFEQREDPNWKARQQIKRNREELMDKSELGL